MNSNNDSTSKQHRIVIVASLFIGVFLYLDAYLFPLKHTTETITKLSAYRSSGRRGTSNYTTFTMTTEVRTYDIPALLFTELRTDSKIGLEKSYITGAIRKVHLDGGEFTYIYTVGYLRTGLGKIFVPAMMLAALAMLLFFKVIDNIRGRANLTYAVFIFALLLLFAHMELDIF
ncbi:MAG TPA: hypothetical protein VFR58_03775 [Flavisolibacter sp.]|nr:hypothetical protein [Flavisolibacter sp.]